MHESPCSADAPADVEPLFPGGVMRARHHFSVSVYWFATNLLWSGLMIVALPKHMEMIAPGNYAQSEGLLLALGAIPGLLVPLIVGPISDRCMSRLGRRRPYMAAGVAINIAGLALLWLAIKDLSLGLYYLGYLILNTGNNIASGSYAGLIPDVVPVAQRGEASGWMAAMTQVGNIVGILSAGIFVGKGLHGGFLGVVSGALVVCLGITLIGVREHPRTSLPGPLHWVEFIKRLWVDPHQYPDFAWVWITRALVTMGFYTVQPYLQFYLGHIIGVPYEQRVMTTAYVFIVILGFATITGLIGGKVSDRIGRKRVVYVANSVIAAACLAFPFGHSMQFVYIVSALFGLGYGAYYSVDWALGCDVLPNQEDAAKDMAVWHIALVLPQTLTPPLAGLILAAFKGAPEIVDGKPVAVYAFPGYLIIFCLAAAFMLLGAILLRNVRKVR
jgi:MFS family permease